MISCNVCLQGMRLDKRMLELATSGLYGHDGEWLNCLATISKFVFTNPVRPGNSGVFVFSLWQVSVNCIVHARLCSDSILAKALLRLSLVKFPKCQESKILGIPTSAETIMK